MQNDANADTQSTQSLNRYISISKFLQGNDWKQNNQRRKL